ncbi:MAG: DUF7088 domain-containing protein, partial [Phycisphaerales bacterium]
MSGLLVLIAIVSVNNVAMQPVARIRIDATGTRAYTLSEQTRLLLDSLENPWKIVVLLDDATVAKPVIQQVDEVLRRYSEGSSHIEVERINPANPASISQYEALLQTLLHLYEGELSTAERAIDSAVASFQELMVFASSTSAWAEQVAELTSKSKEKETLQTVASSLALLGSDGGLILNEVTKAMQVDAGHPLPQINSARDILVAATGQWSQELAEVAWWLSDGKSMSISSICASQVSAFEKMAVQLAKCDDELRQLGNLELGQLAMQLASGEGAIIISEDSATMIPASLIFPRSGIMQET